MCVCVCVCVCIVHKLKVHCNDHFLHQTTHSHISHAPMHICTHSHVHTTLKAAFFMQERDIMAWNRSPWITSLSYAFQDATNLYLVMDFHPGGDLLTVMERQEGGLGEEKARFYLAEIAAGLQDLHKLGFVHRDVKPENVIIARSGHTKLVDFGSAARLDKSGNVVSILMNVNCQRYGCGEEWVGGGVGSREGFVY